MRYHFLVMGIDGKYGFALRIIAATVIVAITAVAAFCYAPAARAEADSPFSAVVRERPDGLYLEWTDAPASSFTVAWTHSSGGNGSLDLSGTNYLALASVMSEYGGGEFVFTVTAHLSDGSALRAQVAYTLSVRLPAPASLIYGDGVLSWNEVSGADSYTVILNGVKVALVTECAFDTDGFLPVTSSVTAEVIANGSGFNLDSEPATLSFSRVAPPLTPYFATLSQGDGSIVVSWAVTDGTLHDSYVYRAVLNGTTLVCGETSLNRLDLTSVVTESGTLTFSVACKRGDVLGAPLSASFEITLGEVQQ